MSTIENNKLIAEFMEEIKIGDFFAIKQKAYTFDKLKYNYSWNWLMEVVEKIESLGYNTKIESLEHTRVSIGNGKLYTLIQVDKEIKIQAVYNACVEFIKWYNQQKNKKT